VASQRLRTAHHPRPPVLVSSLASLRDWELLQASLRWHDDAIVVDRGDVVYLRNDIGSLHLPGGGDAARLVHRMSRLLNGSRTIAEVTAGLTPGNRRSFLQLVRRLAEKGFVGIDSPPIAETVVLLVDRKALASACADRLADLHVGATLAQIEETRSVPSMDRNDGPRARILYPSADSDVVLFSRQCVAASERYESLLLGGVHQGWGYIGLSSRAGEGGCWNCWLEWLRERVDAPETSRAVSSTRDIVWLAEEFVADRIAVEVARRVGTARQVPASAQPIRTRMLLFTSETMDLAEYDVDPHPLCNRCSTCVEPGSKSAVAGLLALSGLERTNAPCDRWPAEVPTIADERINPVTGVWQSLSEEHLNQMPLFRSEARVVISSPTRRAFAELACAGSGLSLGEARWRALSSGLEAYLGANVFALHGQRAGACEVKPDGWSAPVRTTPYLIELPSMRLERLDDSAELEVRHWGPVRVARTFESLFQEAFHASVLSLIQELLRETLSRLLLPVDVSAASADPEQRLLLTFLGCAPAVFHVPNIFGVPALIGLHAHRGAAVAASGPTLNDATRELLRNLVQLDQSTRSGGPPDAGTILLDHIEPLVHGPALLPPVAGTSGAILRALSGRGASVVLRTGPTLKVGSTVYRSGMIGQLWPVARIFSDSSMPPERSGTTNRGP
jgi:hypothetical protein